MADERPLKKWHVWRRPRDQDDAPWEKAGEMEARTRGEVMAAVTDAEARRLDETAWEYWVTDADGPPPADDPAKRWARRHRL